MTTYTSSFGILVIIALSCSPQPHVTSAYREIPDSLLVTISCFNLSENMTGNDEVLILCYVQTDSSQNLAPPIFSNKVSFSTRSPYRWFKCRLNPKVVNESLLLVLLELDSDLSAGKVDSIFRANHRPILQSFSTRNYSGVEQYFGDDDILGYTLIRKVDFSQPNVYDFIGRYKLDKYEYQVTIQGS